MSINRTKLLKLIRLQNIIRLLIMLSEQFILILNKLNISGYRAAKDLGVTQTTISNIKKGTQPSTKIILSMVELYNVNPMWMFLNEGEMFLSAEQKRLGIEPGDTEGLPVSEINLKVDHKNKSVSLVNDPAIEYAVKKQTIQFDIIIENNKVKEISGVRVVESKEFNL